MSGITLAQAQNALANWIEADEKVSQSQSYTIQTENGSRTLTRANAAWIKTQIEFWDKKVQQLSVPANRRRRSVKLIG